MGAITLSVARLKPSIGDSEVDTSEPSASGTLVDDSDVGLGEHAEGEREPGPPADVLPIEPMNLAPGVIVPGTRYRIERWLGDGSTGIVYEASHVDIERRVALKILREEANHRGRGDKVFRREARLASRVGSEHIAEIYDFARLPDGRLMIAMELVEGVSLAVLVDDAPLEASRLLAIMRQMCKALDAAHGQGIVHRDIKPQNVIVGHSRRPDHIKLVDFGVSTPLNEGWARSDALVGTPYSMAPEQIERLPIDARTDIYALGCTAYQLVMGRPPFMGKSREEIYRQHLEATPAPLRNEDGAPLVPAEIAAVIERCLEKDPLARFESASDLEAALCEAQIACGLTTDWDDLELPNVPPARREKIARRMPTLERRRRGKWPSILAAVLAFGATAAVWSVRGNEGIPADQSQIDMLVIEARGAAAKAYFVYPPSDDPQFRTAYSRVLELEAIDGADGGFAQSRANELRDEFATTLARLGDYYWDAVGGRPFAIDYYAQVLVFQPAHDRAAKRAWLTAGELAFLRHKADSQDFTEAELVTADALIALAEPDPGDRRDRLDALGGRRETRGAISEVRLATLIDGLQHQTPAPSPGPMALPGQTNGVVAQSPAQPPHAQPSPTESLPKPRSAPAEPVQEGSEPDEGARPPKERKPARPPKVVPNEAQVETGKRARDRRLAADKAQAARVEFGRGRWSAARKLFIDALDYDPNYAPAHMGLSDTYFEQGDYARAATAAEKAVRIRGRNAEYRVRYGDALRKLGRRSQARQQYEMALALGHAAAEGRLSGL